MEVESWDDGDCNMNENEGTVAVQISKRQKLNGRQYKEWVKSLVKVKATDSPIQKESFLPQIEVNVAGQKDSIGNETTDLSCSTPESVCFRLKRIKYTSDTKRSSSPDHATQNEGTKNSILESQGNVNESKLQENASGEECKSTIANFVEYWVPVKLSKLQMEQYCSSLLSNSMVLCSPYECNTTKILHEILVSTKKCCDHPYLVDRSLDTSLMEGVPQSEQLDAQIKLSGKLLLLHKTLLEIKKRGLRVLILYQTLGGYESITTGDILDDIIHEEFGRDSFIRIDGQMIPSKRRAVLDSFNDQKGGKFVCLMEIRACIPSIKLGSIDAVFFFNSNCDPMSDLKALQRINLDSQFEQVKVFRLYTAYTVEEKVLMLTKRGKTVEVNQRNIKRSTYHELLTWGAYYLFQKLDDFHDSTADTDSIVSHENSFVEDVFQELLTVLPNYEKTNAHTKNLSVLEVQQIGGVYSTNLSLVGEEECPLMDSVSAIKEMLLNEPPYVFWMNLLEGRKPRSKYVFCRSTRRARNRHQKLPGSSLQATQKAANMMEYIRAPVTSQVNHTEVLQSACKVLQIELERLQKQKIEFLNQHNDIKVQTRMECEREIERIQKKYEAMLQKADMAFLEEKGALETRYNKVYMNKALAESSMQEVSHNATFSQVTTRFVMEQTCKLISQRTKSNTMIRGKQVAEQAIEASPDLHLSGGVKAGCLTTTAPHLRHQVGHSRACTVSNWQSERPEIIYSPVTLQQGTSRRR